MKAAQRLLPVGIRALSLLFVAALALAACGGDQPTAIDLGGGATVAPATTAPATADAATTRPAATEPAATDPSSPAAPATTQPATTQPARQRPEGPDAPDFELALGGPGGAFALAAEARPVFMVFWAEW